ncbi:hypothetical protein [Streptomyces sp. HB132]|uniref:hypothetical protein n=1 Tax=Streptomyces sp. HB132 TaxID=767388 RepID=UPI0019610967|nr:hypothetical protein [Streptomyces sp. HB132]MBM7440098.1 hypothetical protein [Streptomyces sp. HB132]
MPHDVGLDMEVFMDRWKIRQTRIFTGRKKWPFHVFTRVTDPVALKALHDHLHEKHGALWWPDRSWEGMVAEHCSRHDRDGWGTHLHNHIPETSWE